MGPSPRDAALSAQGGLAEERILAAGRFLLAAAAFAIPLAFCKETMYIFQAKILLLQYCGLGLGCLMVLHQLISRQAPAMASGFALRLMWAYLLWEIFKSFNSICGVISWRDMSRIFWYPIIALSVPYFCRTRAQFERLINVILICAVIAHLYMWLLWVDGWRSAVLDKPVSPKDAPFDFAEFPILGPFFKWLFYPAPFLERIQALNPGGKLLALSPNSFFAGKEDAGTFGNKNFLTAFLNISCILMMYRAATLSFDGLGQPAWRVILNFLGLITMVALGCFGACVLGQTGTGLLNVLFWSGQGLLALAVYGTYVALCFKMPKLFSPSGTTPTLRLALAHGLLALALLGFYHIAELGNRSSQIGFFFGLLCFVVFALTVIVLRRLLPLRWTLRLVVISLFLIAAATTVIYQRDPGRFMSIFTIQSSSNELRVHTWKSYWDAWLHDAEAWPGATAWGGSWTAFGPWRWLTGFGAYTFRIMYPKYRSPRIFQIEYNQHNTETSHAHNEYLDQLGELGIIGLTLYFLLIAAISYRFLRASGRDDPRTLLLRAALLFALVSQLAHQGLDVAYRYTCSGFPFWLLLGLMLWMSEGPLVPPAPATIPRWRPQLRAALLAAGMLLVMPDPSYPLQLMRGQHFYEMGQIHYTATRDLDDKLSAQRAQIQQGQEELKRFKEQGKGDAAARAEDYLRRARDNVAGLERVFERYHSLADAYFTAGTDYDAANFESYYIGANMNVQFGRSFLLEGNYDRALDLYQRALAHYDYVAGHAPYFVQVRYWQGVCYSGIADCHNARYRAGDAGRRDAVVRNFERCIEHFDFYQRQDAVLREVYFEKYRARLLLAQLYTEQKDLARAQEHTRAGRSELVAALKNFERGGYDLFDESSRLTASKLLEEYMRLQEPASEARAREALSAYNQVMEQRSAALLLPFVPKTERHAKGALEFLEP